MEEQFAELLTAHESLKLRVIAIEEALVNLQGFFIEGRDSSQQGRVVYGTNDGLARAEARSV